MTDVGGTKVRPRRDRPTLVAYASYGLVGWLFYGIGASITLVRDDLGLTRTQVSVLSIGLAVGTVVGAVIAPSVTRRFGRGHLLRAASILLAIGVLIYTTGAPLWMLVSGPILGALAGSFVVVGASAFITTYQGSAGDAALTEANVVTGAAQLIAPFLVGVAATTALGWQASLWLLAALCIVVEFARGRDLAVYDVGEPTRRTAESKRPLPSRYWFAAGALLLVVSIDTCLLLWGPDLLRDRGGFGPAGASAAVSAIVGGFIVGRLIGARLVERWSTDRVLAASILLAAVAFLGTWLATGPIMLIGLALTGIGMGPQFSLGLARAMRATDGQPDRGAGIATAINGVALGVAPFLLAALADASGVHTAFLLVLGFLVVALVVVLARPVPSAAVEP